MASISAAPHTATAVAIPRSAMSESAAAAMQQAANNNNNEGAAVAAAATMGADPKGSSSGDVQTSNTITEQNISYSAERIIGNGSFGVVFEAKVVETGEVVAIKKVLQDKRFKNRELQIMRQLVKDPHPNIVALRHCFYSQVRQVIAFCRSGHFHTGFSLNFCASQHPIAAVVIG